MFDGLQNQSDQKNKPPLESPVPAAPKEDISQRIKGLEEQGRQRGSEKKLYSIIGIVVILLFAGGISFAGYYFWPEITAGFNKLIGKSEVADDMGINNNSENEAAKNQNDYHQELIKGSEKFLAEWKNCIQDSDCAETQADCCECNNGGIQTAINAQYLEEWQYKIKHECQGTACATVYNCKNGKAVCENNKCEFREDTENISASSTEENMNLDSDNDGLTDADEAQYGTDPNNPDSDNDGYSDGDEVKNGYNPIGEGKLELNTSTLDLLPAQKLVIQNAAVALEKEDIDSFVSYVPVYEQDSMRYQFKEFSQTALYGLANTLRNAIVINQTEKNVELETVMDLPGGIKQPVTFEMILEGESWKITGL